MKQQMGEDRPCHYPIPLVTRLDRMDSAMKYIERNIKRKQNLSRWSSHNLVRRAEGQCKPLNLAVEEAHSKGTLLDRVASLEDRLLQVRLSFFNGLCINLFNTA
ncbi:hypothetical protein U1Q18_019154 [Sarracenia purpurea var. burkii]